MFSKRRAATCEPARRARVFALLPFEDTGCWQLCSEQWPQIADDMQDEHGNLPDIRATRVCNVIDSVRLDERNAQKFVVPVTLHRIPTHTQLSGAKAGRRVPAVPAASVTNRTFAVPCPGLRSDLDPRSAPSAPRGREADSHPAVTVAWRHSS